MTSYHTIDGEPCSLQHLCRKEPDWAASRIETMRAELAALEPAEGPIPRASESVREVWIEQRDLLAVARVSAVPIEVNGTFLIKRHKVQSTPQPKAEAGRVPAKAWVRVVTESDLDEDTVFEIHADLDAPKKMHGCWQYVDVIGAPSKGECLDCSPVDELDEAQTDVENLQRMLDTAIQRAETAERDLGMVNSTAVSLAEEVRLLTSERDTALEGERKARTEAERDYSHGPRPGREDDQ